MTEGSGNTRRRLVDLGLRLLFIFCLLAAIIIEGYYIVRLRDRITTQTEELQHISFQLQTMKHERDTLQEQLSSVKGRRGEDQDGDTAQR